MTFCRCALAQGEKPTISILCFVRSLVAARAHSEVGAISSQPGCRCRYSSIQGGIIECTSLARRA